MLELEKIKSSGFFQELIIQKGDILFREGDINPYLYIIYDGELVIEKHISLQDSYKFLGNLGVGNILGEGALSNEDPKEVQARANRTTHLLKIEGKGEFPSFMKQYPELGYQVLVSIIQLTNSRLLRSNREITANYEVNLAISKIKDFSPDSIYKLLIIFESILGVDQIMYFEKNIVMDQYYKLRYDSKSTNSLQNIIFKFKNDVLDKELVSAEGVIFTKFTRHVMLKIGENNYGFLLIGRDKKDFYENEEKLLHNTAGSFVAIIHQKKLIEEQRNKNYMRNA